MPYKQLTFRAAAREKVLEGATLLADAVRVTLGPKAKCVLIEKKWDAPSSATTVSPLQKSWNSRITEATLTELPDTKNDHSAGPGLPEG